jgi:hypothetical protein
MSKRERTMLMVLGGVAVLALAFFLLTRGGDEPVEEPITQPPIAEPEPSPTVTGPPRVPPLAIFGGRDPFFPLAREDTGGGDGNGGAQPSPSPTGGPQPTVSPAPSPGDGDDDGRPDLRVLDIFIRNGTEFVQVEVRGDVFTVREGETFAGNFKVVSIDGRCATFLFGDEQFTECEPGVQK